MKQKENQIGFCVLRVEVIATLQFLLCGVIGQSQFQASIGISIPFPVWITQPVSQPDTHQAHTLQHQAFYHHHSIPAAGRLFSYQ